MSPSVFRFAVIAFVVCLMPLMASAQAAAGLDQYQTTGNNGWMIDKNRSMGQWVTVGSDGLLSAVEFCLRIGLWPDDLVVEIFDFDRGTVGALLGSTTISASDHGPWQLALDINSVTATLIPLEHLGIVVSNGQTIAISMSSTTAPPDHWQVYGVFPSFTYPNGDLIMNLSVMVMEDLTFKTFVAQPVFGDGFESGDTTLWSTAVP